MKYAIALLLLLAVGCTSKFIRMTDQETQAFFVSKMIPLDKLPAGTDFSRYSGPYCDPDDGSCWSVKCVGQAPSFKCWKSSAEAPSVGDKKQNGNFHPEDAKNLCESSSASAVQKRKNCVDYLYYLGNYYSSDKKTDEAKNILIKLCDTNGATCELNGLKFGKGSLVIDGTLSVLSGQYKITTTINNVDLTDVYKFQVIQD